MVDRARQKLSQLVLKISRLCRVIQSYGSDRTEVMKIIMSSFLGLQIQNFTSLEHKLLFYTIRERYKVDATAAQIILYLQPVLGKIDERLVCEQLLNRLNIHAHQFMIDLSDESSDSSSGASLSSAFARCRFKTKHPNYSLDDSLPQVSSSMSLRQRSRKQNSLLPFQLEPKPLLATPSIPKNKTMGVKRIKINPFDQLEQKTQNVSHCKPKKRSSNCSKQKRSKHNRNKQIEYLPAKYDCMPSQLGPVSSSLSSESSSQQYLAARNQEDEKQDAQSQSSLSCRAEKNISSFDSISIDSINYQKQFQSNLLNNITTQRQPQMQAWSDEPLNYVPEGHESSRNIIMHLNRSKIQIELDFNLGLAERSILQEAEMPTIKAKKQLPKQ